MWRKRIRRSMWVRIGLESVKAVMSIVTVVDMSTEKPTTQPFLFIVLHASMENIVDLRDALKFNGMFTLSIRDI